MWTSSKNDNQSASFQTFKMADLVQSAPISGIVEAPKSFEEFRNYIDSDRQEIVVKHYREMRTKQTVDFVQRMHKKYSFETPRATMSIRECFIQLESYVDSSDPGYFILIKISSPRILNYFIFPDVSLPNKVHMFQTAEGIRNAGHPDWMQVAIVGI